MAQRKCYEQVSARPLCLVVQEAAYPKSAPSMLRLASLRRPFEYSSSNFLRSYSANRVSRCSATKHPNGRVDPYL